MKSDQERCLDKLSQIWGTKMKSATETYKGYEIWFDIESNATPIRSLDWAYCHESYTGKEDAELCGRAGSIEECKKDIDDFIESDGWANEGWSNI